MLIYACHKVVIQIANVLLISLFPRATVQCCVTPRDRDKDRLTCCITSSTLVYVSNVYQNIIEAGWPVSAVHLYAVSVNGKRLAQL